MTGIVQRVYNAVLRDHLPRKWAVYDDIPARDARLFDTTDHVDPYKPGLHTAIESCVNGGTAVLVGGGRGISSIWLARHCDRVIAYEAAAEMVEIARQTVAMQGWSDSVDVRHALIGDAIDVYGDYDDATVLSPASLPTADCLVMDCEGAEVSILDGMAEYPHTIIVETHPERGVSTARTRQRLSTAGYNITALQYEPVETPKRVLVGEQ